MSQFTSPASNAISASFSGHNVPVTIEHARATHTATVNQRAKPPIPDRFVSLGAFPFKIDHPVVVTVENRDTDGYVVIDALQLTHAELDYPRANLLR